MMLSTLPTWGPGHLRFRDNDPNASGTEREVIFLQAGDIFYKNLGERCVDHGIGATGKRPTIPHGNGAVDRVWFDGLRNHGQRALVKERAM